MSTRKDNMEKAKVPVKPTKPDYEHWGAANCWTVHEAGCLLIDIQPISKAELGTTGMVTAYRAVKLLMERDTGKSLKYSFYKPGGEFQFTPYIVLEWAKNQSVPVPPRLKAAVLQSYPTTFQSGVFLDAIVELKLEIQSLNSELEEKSKASNPPYLNTDHGRFSPELSAAVRVWLALFDGGNFQEKRGPKPQIIAWLEMDAKNSGNAKLLSKNAVDRIAMIVNPHKSGGAPRSA